MTDAEQLAEWLEEASLDACESGYGQPYPDETAVVAGHVVVASLADHKEHMAPELQVYKPEQVRRWVKAVKRYLKNTPDSDICEALEETRSQGKG